MVDKNRMFMYDIYDIITDFPSGVCVRVQCMVIRIMLLMPFHVFSDLVNSTGGASKNG